MLTTMSPTTVVPDRRFTHAALTIQQSKALFEVQRRLHVVERQAELDHREGHLRLQADDPGPGVNWLPAPKDALFYVVLRLYQPHADHLALRFDYPPIQPI